MSQSQYPQVNVQLIRAESHHLSAFRISEASKLVNGFGQQSHIPLEDGSLVPVPYGSIENYAKHLAQEWSVDDAYVMLVVTVDYCESSQESTSAAPDVLTKEFQDYIQSLPEDTKQKVDASLVESSSANPDNANDQQPNAC